MPIREIAIKSSQYYAATRDDFGADAAAFMDALGLEQVVVVGHSMGSTNALRFAVDHPERTLGLVLAGSFATYRGNPAVVEFWETAISPLTDPIDPRFAQEFQQSTLAQPVPAAFFDTVVQESLKVPAHVWRAAFQGFLEDDFASELGQIKAPTLIVWGARDVFCPRTDQEALLGAIRSARMVVYEGSGHALHWEEPERFAADVVTFAESLAGSGQATLRPVAHALRQNARSCYRGSDHPIASLISSPE